jgi:hypothetical protein
VSRRASSSHEIPTPTRPPPNAELHLGRDGVGREVAANLARLHKGEYKLIVIRKSVNRAVAKRLKKCYHIVGKGIGRKIALFKKGTLNE